MFVPYDPEERGVFLKQLRSASGTDRAGAAHHLAHYPDAEVIAALKKCLTDDYFNDQLVDEAPGKKPRTAKIYVVRLGGLRVAAATEGGGAQARAGASPLIGRRKRCVKLLDRPN